MKICNHLFVTLKVICVSYLINETLSLSSYDRIFEWEVIPDTETRTTLNVLQKYHNASAILHFIELTHNFSNNNNNKGCLRESLSSLNFSVKVSSYKSFSLQAETALKTSNLLTNLFTMHRNESLQSPILNQEFFWSLVRANVQSDPFIFGSGIAFSANAFLNSNNKNDNNNNLWRFAPYAFRNSTNNSTINSIIFYDLANTSPQEKIYDKTLMRSSHSDNYSLSGDWFWAFATTNYSALLSHWHKKEANFLISIDEGIWTSPYFDCGATNTWLITYIVPFFGSSLNDKHKMEFK
jgi:hypothetical protein